MGFALTLPAQNPGREKGAHFPSCWVPAVAPLSPEGGRPLSRGPRAPIRRGLRDTWPSCGRWEPLGMGERGQKSEQCVNDPAGRAGGPAAIWGPGPVGGLHVTACDPHRGTLPTGPPQCPQPGGDLLPEPPVPRGGLAPESSEGALRESEAGRASQASSRKHPRGLSVLPRAAPLCPGSRAGVGSGQPPAPAVFTEAP